MLKSIQSNAPALDIAHWLIARLPGLTHLKLQKLCFYAYGYLTALADIEVVPFEAWQHGPVSRRVWEQFKTFGAQPLQNIHLSEREFSTAQVKVLEDVVAIYGQLSAWQLRELSHAESPWVHSAQKSELEIPDVEVRSHFALKTHPGTVELPEPVANSWSLKLDGLPVPKFESFHSAAQLCREIRVI
jgi:uncharacterized phage-associated protein